MSNRILRSTTVVSFLSLLSRGMGFVRDVLIAHWFGASGPVDAFLVAFKIPNFMRRLFSEGAFAQVFVPVLSEYKLNSHQKPILAFINHMSGILGFGLLLITLVGELAAPWIIALFAPGYLGNPEQFQLATQLLQITLPYLMLITLTAFISAILNAYGRFAVPAFTPLLLNLSLILSACFLAPYFSQPITALAWGVFIAGAAQLMFQLPFLWRLGLLPKPKFSFKDSKVNQVLKRMIPALFGVSVAQLGMLLDTFFASFLPPGSIAWLYYAERVASLPLGIFGVAIATVVLPYLSWRQDKQNDADYSRILDGGIRWVLMISIPASLALLLLTKPLLISLFHYGEFTQHDVEMTALSLMIYALSIPCLMLVKILASGFYAKQDIRAPVRFAAIALSVNIGLDILLVYPLAHAGLALGLTLSSFVNAALLFWGIHHTGYFKFQPGWGKFLLQLTFANLMLVLMLVWSMGQSQQWIEASGLTRIGYLSCIVCGGIVVYFIALYIVGFRHNNVVMIHERSDPRLKSDDLNVPQTK